MPDNKRYIGDVFIDGKTDRLLHEFLTNLFNQYNGEGKGFNADMLDGHHYLEIENELSRLDSEKLSTLVIGSSVFNANHSTDYLHFSDIIYDDYTELPWKQNIPNNYNITETLTDLFQYIDTIMQDRDDLKVDKEPVDPEDESEEPRMKVLSDNNFTDTDKAHLDALSESVIDNIVPYVDESNVTHSVLNSTLTNGLRFILITQDRYDALKNSQNPDERDYIDSWRNVFIIKDEENMPDSVEYANPLSYKLTDGYQFRLANDEQTAPTELNQIDFTSEDPVWLQFKHNWASNWINIAPMEDFLLGANFDNTIQMYLEEFENYKINQISLLNSLKELTLDQQSEIDTNWSEYPFLSSTLHNDYVKYITFDGDDQYIESTELDDFKTADINLEQLFKDYNILQQDGTNNITAINNQVNTNQSNIRTLQNQVSSINQINNTQTQDINNLSSSVSSLSSRITPLENINKNYRLLVRHVVPSYYDVRVYTNNSICYVWLRWLETNLHKQPYQWDIGINTSDWPSPPIEVLDDSNQWYRPLGPVSFLDLTGKVMFSLRDNDGCLYHKSMTGKVLTSGDFWASTTYVPRGLLPSP